MVSVWILKDFCLDQILVDLINDNTVPLRNSIVLKIQKYISQTSQVFSGVTSSFGDYQEAKRTTGTYDTNAVAKSLCHSGAISPEDPVCQKISNGQ